MECGSKLSHGAPQAMRIKPCSSAGNAGILAGKDAGAPSAGTWFSLTRVPSGAGLKIQIYDHRQVVGQSYPFDA